MMVSLKLELKGQKRNKTSKSIVQKSFRKRDKWEMQLAAQLR